jgi:hypothetical protein
VLIALQSISLGASNAHSPEPRDDSIPIRDPVAVGLTILAFTRRRTSILAERGGAEKGAGA